MAPLDELLVRGHFPRMQDVADRLSDTLEPRCFYLFVSHRWLDPAVPDPGNRQAALVAWQVVGHLLNAIWVGSARGRHGPRKFTMLGHTHIGIRGSEIGESILVNLLRGLSEEEFAALAAEAELFDDVGDDFGRVMALEDVGLERLRSRIDRAPRLRDALGRFRIWYDYSCMPQHPRTSEEQERFERILGRLGAMQALGFTVVLLDEVDDYFGRAWCTLESSFADQHLNSTLDVWHGSEGCPAGFARRESSFRRVLHDRSHLVHRGIMDTEVFGVQSPDECMSRLGLETTRPEDRAIVYDLLRKMGPPRSIHFDDAEVVTGVFPLPIRAGKAVVVAEAGRSIAERKPNSSSTLDGSDSRATARIGPGGLPAFESFEGETGRDAGPAAHVAIFGRCEGESILYARWVRDHRSELGEALKASVRSLSWVASDVAPVGHFAIGELEIRPVESSLWVVLGTHSAIRGGYTTRVLVESLAAAGIEYVVFEVDERRNNLTRYAPTGDQPPEARKALLDFEPGDPALTTYPGGLFRTQFMQRLGARP